MYPGLNLMLALKETSGSSFPQLGLKINNFNEYFIRPIPTKAEFIKTEDVICLTDWRNKYPNAFLSEFTATQEQTHAWLKDQVHFDDTRMLFMVEDSNQSPIAYLGIGYINWENSYVEADSIVSGGNSPKYLMQNALHVLINWAIGQLGLINVGVRVMSDNSALYFYKKIGFIETERLPLRKETEHSMVRWVEDSSIKNASRYLVHHYLGTPKI